MTMSRTDRELMQAFRNLFSIPLWILIGLARLVCWIFFWVPQQPEPTPPRPTAPAAALALPVAIPLPPEAIPVPEPASVDDVPLPESCEPLPPSVPEPSVPPSTVTATVTEARYRKQGQRYVEDANGTYRRVMQGRRVRYQVIAEQNAA